MNFNKVLLSDIVSTDFLFLNDRQNMCLKILDLYETNKNIKQLICLLKFVIKTEGGLVYILIKNKFLYYLASKYFSQFKTPKRLILINNFSILKQKKETQNDSLIINFEPIYKTNKNLKQLIENNRFLVYSIGSSISTNSSGIYILRNNLDDYKKLFFLLIIITKILNKKNEKN